MFCARCGQKIPDNSEICSYCGQPANWNWQTPPPAPDQPAAAAPMRQYAPLPGAAYAVQGIGGTLLFFCICFTILWPLWVLSQYAEFHFRMSPLAVMGLVRLVFGVLVGIMLWTRQSAAMVLLRVHLAVTALFTAYNLLVALLLLFRYTYVPFAALRVFSSIAVSVVFLLSAIIYFSVSQRVRATYGSKLFG